MTKTLLLLALSFSTLSVSADPAEWIGPNASIFDQMSSAQLREYKLKNRMMGALPYTAQETALRAKFVAKYGEDAFFNYGADMLKYPNLILSAVQENRRY